MVLSTSNINDIERNEYYCKNKNKMCKYSTQNGYCMFTACIEHDSDVVIINENCKSNL